MLARSIDYIFKQILQKQRNANITFKVSCQLIGIYNESIVDLINPSSGPLNAKEDLENG